MHFIGVAVPYCVLPDPANSNAQNHTRKKFANVLLVVRTKLVSGGLAKLSMVGAPVNASGNPVSPEAPLRVIVVPLPGGGKKKTPAAVEMAGQFVALIVFTPEISARF